MKKTNLFSLLLFSCVLSLAGQQAQGKANHISIYSKKIKRIVNAVNLGDFLTENAYLEMLQTACNRNSCSSLEKQTIRNVGVQILNCKIEHLKAHGIENSDAVTICNSTSAMIGCDSLSSALLRKMCYTGNNHSLQVLKEKESRLNNRMPASE